MVFFDPTTVDRAAKITPLPNGEYVVKIDKAMSKEADDKLGLTVFLNVWKPDAHLNRSVIDNFNLRHPNAVAQEIGQRRFAQLLDIIGLGDKPLQSESLIEGKFVKVVLGQEAGYPDKSQTRNKVIKYLALDESDKDGLPADLSEEVPF